MFRIYFDTEFTGLRKNTDLISIGCIDDSGRNSFYGEITGLNLEDETIPQDTRDFLKKEVIPGTHYYSLDSENEMDQKIILTRKSYSDEYRGNVVVLGTKKQVADKFMEWAMNLLDINDDNDHMILPVSDVMYYDMVLLMDLVNASSAGDDKHAICPCGIDINEMIANKMKLNYYAAFDKNREDLLEQLEPDNPSEFYPGKKHNALYDARIIRSLYYALSKYKKVIL